MTIRSDEYAIKAIDLRISILSAKGETKNANIIKKLKRQRRALEAKMQKKNT